MITTEYQNFFAELEKNNHRDWFHENKKCYEKHVKKPFESLVSEMIMLENDYQPMHVLPKDLIFRINRDIRFSKDKAPYKLNRSAVISPNGKKDHSRPAIYFELGAINLSIAGGVWAPDKDQLLKIREFIASDIEGFKEIANEKQFVSTFKEIKGDRNKRLPKDLAEVAEDEPRIYNKQFYWWIDMPLRDAIAATEGHLANYIMERVADQRTQQEYFTEAMGTGVS
jgi:uncharacterized protein (TIGR02453 family)